VIVSTGHLKIVDGVFYYPGIMSDEWIIQDPVRELMRGWFSNLRSTENILVISAHGIRKDTLKSLLAQNRGKKILMTYCGENIFVKNRLISHVYNGLGKLGISGKLKEALVLHPMTASILSANTLLQKNAYFRSLLEVDKAYNYLLTNDLQPQKDNVFFAPYFYFFCRDVMPLLQRSPASEEIQIKKKFCAFVVSNPANFDRIDFFRKLSEYKKIDSFGKVLNNAQIESLPGEHYLSLLKYNHLLYKKYKFVISFENSYAKGYITEKLINVLAGGSVPIYRGADDIGTYFNLNRIVDFNHYGRSYINMIDKIIELDQDDAKYRTFVSEPCLPGNTFPPGYEDLGHRLETFMKVRLGIGDL